MFLVLRSSLTWLLLIFVTASCAKKDDYSQKILYERIEQNVKGFDPIHSNDYYSSREVGKVYEGLLEFHYLKRPYTVTPNLAKEMPQVSKNGLTYTFKIIPGVLFHDDECFPGGIGRELVAEDFVYSFKRLADPKLVATGWWLFDEKIKGLNEWRNAQKDTAISDYSASIEGVKALDKYTLQFVLSKPFPQFLYGLAMSFSYVVPKEAVDKYGAEFINHPVGTGPFTLKVYSPQTNKIEYYKNKKFRDKFYPSEGEESDKANGLLADAGKKVPFLDKIVSYIMVEHNPAWLAILKGEIDEFKLPKDNLSQAITDMNGPTEELKSRGIEVVVERALDVTYSGFNTQFELFKNNPKLRQAMSHAYDAGTANELFYHNQGILAQTPIPPGIAGYDENYKNPNVGYDLEKAKKLLAEAGYPGGKGLPEITYDNLSDTLARQMAEFFSNSLAKIGVKIKPIFNTWPEMTKKIDRQSVQLFAISWIADYPDAENFLQLFYGPNASPGSNNSNFNDPAYNALFEKVSKMQDSKERTELYKKLARLGSEQLPWIFGVHRMNLRLKHSWLKNYKATEFKYGIEQYWDIDLEQKKLKKPQL
ncbi:MAG: hypothetical protein JNM93_12655 [Bacteriovoracaceae bacterium]|nr:hypothetical protein [Bacteriovoracaceae bacterium]